MEYRIVVQSWIEAFQLAIPIRFDVFVKEQKVPEEIEIDEYDESAWHALVLGVDKALGTARLVVEEQDLIKVGRIGRMAVLTAYRNKGLGLQLLQALVNFGLRQGIFEYYLHAQQSAQSFYEKQGFIAEGEIFEEAGILHQAMRLKI